MKRKHLEKLSFFGDPNIGLYAFCTDSYCLLGKSVYASYKKEVEEVLGVPVYEASVANTSFVGIFLAGNSSIVLAPSIIGKDELKRLKAFGLEVETLDCKYNALGNLVLANDNGALISPLLKGLKDKLESLLGIDIAVGTVANLNVVGSCGVATNKGCLLHRDVLEEELIIVQKVLKVEADIGTVNFGSPFVRSGIIANSKGFLVGEQTTGPEIVRCDEALGFI